MLKSVFFDLDGTLLPMDENAFVKGYFGLLAKRMATLGYPDSEKLIRAIWHGTMLMYQNDGKKSNEEVFWDDFLSLYGEECRKDIPLFNDFYVTEFPKTKELCGENPMARTIVDYCHKNLPYTILSTNPIFPRVAQKTRLSFIGLNENDFDFITDYTNSGLCKPNPAYFQWLLEKHNLKPEEVILFGNNTHEDADCATSIGIDTYLLKDCLIRSPKTTKDYPLILMDEIIPTIQREAEARK